MGLSAHPFAPGGSFGLDYIGIAFTDKGLRGFEFPQDTFHLDSLLKAADQGLLALTFTQRYV
jgi:hypothetical protein